MNMADAFIDKYNIIVGTIVALLTFVLGKHWILFLGFLILNLVDWITGWMKSRLAGKENSVKGLKGILKKVGYWIILGLSFGMTVIFIEIGKVIGVDLGITSFFGWMVLAWLIVNEIRSILENLVEAGFDVPSILIKGLSVAEKIIKEQEDSMDGTLTVDKSGTDTDIFKLDLNVPPEELETKNTITLKVETDA